MQYKPGKYAAAIAIVAFFWASKVEAYCQSLTGGGDSCSTPNAEDLKPLLWENPRIEVSIAYSSCPSLDPSELRAAVLGSLAEWKEAGNGCSAVSFVEGPESLAADTNLDNLGIDRVNRIACREDSWPDVSEGGAFGSGGNLVAHASVRHDPQTGLIMDADVDLNLVDFEWTTNGESGRVDLQNALTHELGHVLGFAHSSDQSATMFASASPGETEKRDLEEDDVQAACEVYPFSLLGVGTANDSSIEVNGRVGSCQVGAHPPGAFFSLLLLLLLSLRRRACP